jgi:predicted nucleic acid-binding protein
VKLVVPDASVLLKWVLPHDVEPDQARALELRDAALAGAIACRVPALWLYEVGNTLARLTPAQAPAMLDALQRFGLEEAERDTRWVERALELAAAYAVTFYDASYHAIALVGKGLFVTSDGKYIRKAGAAGAVVVLGDWQPPASGTRKPGQ